MNLNGRLMSCRGSLLAIAVAGLIAGTARADKLDVQLLDEAPKIMDYVHKQGYKNVGVLPFRVQKSKGQAAFNVGPLNTNLATRLENLMVLLVDINNPVGILSEPAKRALASSKTATYHTLPGRKALFEQKYALCWGDTTVKPDAFVGGDVILSSDNKRATVVVMAFDKSGDMKEVNRFSVHTDASILGDAGQSFALARGLVKKRADEQDDAAAQSATQNDQQKDQSSTTSTPAGDNPVSLSILYDGQPANIDGDPNSPGERRARMVRRRAAGATGTIGDPKEGQKVTLILENKSTTDSFAVVLKVNGQNTLYQETQDPMNCTKWVIDPGKRYEVRGFYVSEAGDNLLPFRVLSEEESRQKADEMREDSSLGTIEFYVFRSGGADDDLNISRHASFRGSKRELNKSRTARSLKDVQNEYSQRFNVKAESGKLKLDRDAVKKRAIAKSRGLIGTAEGAPQQGGELKKTDFNNPVEVFGQRIRYYSVTTSTGP